MILLCEMLIFVMTLAWGVLMAKHWYDHGTTFEFPVAVLIFYMIKLVSDISLVLERPHSTLWIDINFGLYTFKYEDWFLSNVDPYIGILLMSLIYFVLNREFTRKRGRASFGRRSGRKPGLRIIH